MEPIIRRSVRSPPPGLKTATIIILEEDGLFDVSVLSHELIHFCWKWMEKIGIEAKDDELLGYFHIHCQSVVLRKLMNAGWRMGVWVPDNPFTE